MSRRNDNDNDIQKQVYDAMDEYYKSHQSWGSSRGNRKYEMEGAIVVLIVDIIVILFYFYVAFKA